MHFSDLSPTNETQLHRAFLNTKGKMPMKDISNKGPSYTRTQSIYEKDITNKSPYIHIHMFF